ncbi:MAG: HypC/HybG/HupF family hydrogenase formation chaperone [bacterium]|nr:HypC/HybG/HupF family hydrogenase formation chaperone [bacterium]
MCLAVPGQVSEIDSREGLAEAVVDFGGVRKRVCLEGLPEARVGDWVLVHAGFALQQLDEAAAEELLGWLSDPEQPAP